MLKEILLKILEKMPDTRSQRNNVDINFTIHDFYKINKAIKKLEKSKTVCNDCIYGNKNMIKDKIVCDIFVSTNRKGTVEKDFGCNKGKAKC